MQAKSFNTLVILGATATGKTSLAVKCAKKFSGEIISADSRQVYKELNIGSGKDLDEYGDVKYHLIDICNLHSEYNVFSFKENCLSAFEKISKKGFLPIITGGTGLYLSSVLSNYNMVKVPENTELRRRLKNLSQEELSKILLKLKPNIHNRSDLKNKERTIRAIEIASYKNKAPVAESSNKIKALTFKINFERAVLRKRIQKRLDERIKQGMIDEVENCLRIYGEERILRLGLEYKFTTLFLKGEYSYAEYFEKLHTAICQFSKRQETWFRKMQREGIEMVELDGSNKPQMLETITQTMKSHVL